MQAHLHVTERRACTALGQHRSTQRKVPRGRPDEERLTARITSYNVCYTKLLRIAIWRSGVWERRVIREELASEVGRSVSAVEYQDILNDRILRTRRIV